MHLRRFSQNDVVTGVVLLYIQITVISTIKLNSTQLNSSKLDTSQPKIKIYFVNQTEFDLKTEDEDELEATDLKEFILNPFDLKRTDSNSTDLNPINLKQTLKPSDLLLYDLSPTKSGLNSFNLIAHKLNVSKLNSSELSELIERFVINFPVDEWSRYGFFTLDYLKKINPHWLQFDPQPKELHFILAGIYTIIMTCGIFGNVLVIYLFFRFKSLRTPANILVINLAISDMCMMLMMPLFIYNSIFMGPALGDLVCRFYGFLGGLSGTCSICTLSAISLDRYYVIRYPLNRRFTNLRAKIAVAISWIYAITFSVIPILDIGLGVYTPEGFLTSCSYDYLTDDRNTRIFILTFFFAAWVIPLVIITFAYMNILKVVLVSRNMKRFKNRESIRHMKVEERKKQELKVSLIVLLVVFMWFAAWTPYATVSLIGIAGYANYINPLSSMIPALLAKTASCLDPFVYALTHPRYKEELKKLLRRSKSKVYLDRSKTDFDDVSVSIVEIPAKKSNQEQPPRLMRDRDLVQKKSRYKPSWWFKPNFSNRTSSLRRIARSLNAREQRNEFEIHYLP